MLNFKIIFNICSIDPKKGYPSKCDFADEFCEQLGLNCCFEKAVLKVVLVKGRKSLRKIKGQGCPPKNRGEHEFSLVCLE